MTRASRRDGSRCGGRRDRGAADALGLVLITPAMIGLALLAVMLSRNVDSRAQMRSAAEAAAQAAALERNALDAEAAANRVAAAMLVDLDACAGLAVDVRYPSAPEPGIGTSYGFVEVDLQCTVSRRAVESLDERSETDRTSVITAVATVDFFRAREAP